MMATHRRQTRRAALLVVTAGLAGPSVLAQHSRDSGTEQAPLSDWDDAGRDGLVHNAGYCFSVCVGDSPVFLRNASLRPDPVGAAPCPWKMLGA